MVAGVRYISLILIGFIYFLSAAQTQTGGDSAELALTANQLWLSHAPGYPLWNQLGHFWLQLFDQEPAGALSILSAVYGLITVACLMSLIEYFVEDKNLATFGGMYLAFTPLFWRYNTVVEVFAFTHMLFFCFLRLGLEFLKTQKIIFAGMALLTLGFLIAHHYFMLPFLFVIGLWWMVRKLNWSTLHGAWIILGLFLFLCGFAPYLIFWVPQNHVAGSTHWHSLSELLNLFLRREYGSFQLFSAPAEPRKLEHLKDFFKFVSVSGGSVLILFLPLTYVGLKSWFTRSPKWQHREVFSVLFLATLVQIGSFIFFSKFEVERHPWLYSTVIRFWILPDLCILMLLLSGLGYFLKSFPLKTLQWQRRANFILVLFLILSIFIQVTKNFKHETRKNIVAYDLWARHIFNLARENNSAIISMNFQESAMLTYVKIISSDFSQIKLITPNFFLNEAQFSIDQDLLLPLEFQSKPIFVRKGILALFKLNPQVDSVILASPLPPTTMEHMINEKVTTLQGCQIFLRNEYALSKLVSLQKLQAWFSAQDVFDPVLPPKISDLTQ